MGARAVSPGAALLRSSRMFSVPKPLPEPQSTTIYSGGNKSATMTRPYPQSQSITSPLSSREKGDWGFKRPFPLKSTLTTSTPLIRVKQVDSVENVTDFMSAADYTISLEKFQELRVALSVPRYMDPKDFSQKPALWFKSVFEKHQDFTYLKHAKNEDREVKQGKGSPKDPPQEPDLWFKSIFEECTGLAYPKPGDQQEQGTTSAYLKPADQQDGLLQEGTDSAGLKNAGQDEGVLKQETESITSADLGPAPDQAEEDTKAVVMEPADQQQGLLEEGMDSAVLGGAGQQERVLKEGMESTDLGHADQPEAVLEQGTNPAAMEPADQQEGMLEKSTDAINQKPNQQDAATKKDPHSADEQEGLFKRRWKFQGPWLARMTQGEFNKYLEKQVRPRRAEFRVLLMDKLAKELTANQNNDAFERGLPAPAPVDPKDITKEQFTEFLRTMRYDRILLYDMISRFLDMAPLGHPLSGVMQSVRSKSGQSVKDESPYERTGPPPSHPSAGISYLRTNAFMENHPIYGPQSHRTPALARVVSPRMGAAPAKLGVGGFVAVTPVGDNEFNVRYGRQRSTTKALLAGITYLDTTTYGGAKAYVEPHTASVDPSGRVVLRLRETGREAPLILKESNGSCSIYDDKLLDRYVPGETPRQPVIAKVSSRFQADRVADGIMDQVLPPDAQDQGEVDDSQTVRV
ncbi:mitochondrial ribosomal protein [Hirsutella rhossiliensis]|uniref:Mitochondrial ribosomal protein n=1 Tax=Hirsutella rhossiliensis TaxID=111463 RepID=A0A9P8SHF8_9HYPO|nr:mitochondrial ribosomal protein [Hirsutella rhossiliensis]KAH0960981.1 mitochondrial ribosomal protein [Hirsutella rhossiliensis]